MAPYLLSHISYWSCISVGCDAALGGGALGRRPGEMAEGVVLPWAALSVSLLGVLHTPIFSSPRSFLLCSLLPLLSLHWVPYPFLQGHNDR